MEKNKINKMKSLISKGRIENVIQLLLLKTSISDEALHANVILLSNRLVRLKHKELNGLLDHKDRDRELNNIIHTIIQVLNSLPDENFEVDKPIQKVKPKSQRTKFVLKIEGNIDDFDKKEIKEIIQRIISFTDDNSVTLKNISSGSIKLHIEADEETFLKLMQLFKDNNLSSLIKHQVKDLEISIEKRTEVPYDIGLSFAGEERYYVRQVAKLLKQKGLRVFYDEFEQVDLWGKDLYQYLSDIYKNKCKYTVIFISEAYAQKRWTKHELESSQARAFNENKEYILPVRFDDTKLPGMHETTMYLNGNEVSPKHLAELTFEKIKG